MYFFMKRYKNPFEAAIEEEEEEEEERDESPPESPVSDSGRGVDGSEEDVGHLRQVKKLKTSDNMEVDLTQIPTVEASDREKKVAKMHAVISQFTEDQMSRYECFRRSTLHKSNMKKLLESITGIKNMNNDDPRLSVISGIAKMFVGELVETARLIMVKRNEAGHIRPCHIRESYRRLKLQGKVIQRTVPRLFR
ncbi:transcription initiation factor TFIID subunit 11-like [Brassica napus]|uniref:transcription initiation factor TFIID subunit 11-like n=1 Tax=Brassica napus TaxID=3708 RepID=UPI000BBEF4C7|nr:transcription initiation factor TFIID subunit 11-like [Brassica napus]XP_048602235.1 transcription initiation factor TFIID subunit 11-like [Brassica napus]